MQTTIKPDCVIVGGGIAGLMTALKFSESHPNQAITVIDSEQEVAAALSGGNGGSLRADEFGVIDLRTAQEWWNQVIKPVEKGGLLVAGMFTETPPETVPQNIPPCRDPRVQAYLQAQLEYVRSGLQVRGHNKLMMKMGFAAMDQWEAFRAAYPDIARKAGYRPGTGGAGAEKPVIIIGKRGMGTAAQVQDLERKFEGRGKKSARALNPNEFTQAVPQLAEFAAKQDGECAYVMQPGGAINAKVLVTEIKKHLQAKLGKKFQFIGGKQLTGFVFAHNNPNRINGVRLKDKTSDEETVLEGEFASKFMLTTGANHGLGEALGIKIPPAMGYAGASITIPIPPEYEKTFATMLPLIFQTDFGAPVISVLKDPDSGKLSLRMGGLKAFTGEEPPSIEQPHIRNLLWKEMRIVAECFPDFMQSVLGRDIRKGLKNIGSEDEQIKKGDLATINAWTGARPVSADVRYSVGHAARTTGEQLENLVCACHLSSSGIAFSPIVGNVAAQLLADKAPRDVEIPGVDKTTMSQFMDMVDPSRKTGILPKRTQVGKQ